MTEEHKTHEQMLAKQALEAHEVKEVLNFFKKHKTTIIYGLATVVAISIVIPVLNQKKINHNAVAGQLLTNAQSDEELQLIIDKHANTSAAPGALLALARSAYNRGEYAKAQTSYNEFLKKFAKHDMAAIAAYGQAACLEAQDNLDAAAAEYQKTADAYAGNFVAPMALFNKGRLLATQGKTTDAIIAFESTISADTTGTWSSQAQNELSKLK